MNQKKFIIPNQISVQYNRQTLIQHQCFGCNGRFIPTTPEDVFCSYCSYDEKKIPKENISKVPYTGILIRDEIEIPYSQRRGSVNYKKTLARDWFICQYCGISPFFDYDGIREKMNVDHISPFSKGGNNKMCNLTTSCFKCNIIAHNKVFPSFYDKKVFIQDRRAELGIPRSLAKMTDDFIIKDYNFFLNVLERTIKNKSYYEEFVINSSKKSFYDELSSLYL